MKHRTKVILGLAAVLLLAGCGKGKAETLPTVSEKSQGQYVAGTYLGKGVGYARGSSRSGGVGIENRVCGG